MPGRRALDRPTPGGAEPRRRAPRSREPDPGLARALEPGRGGASRLRRQHCSMQVVNIAAKLGSFSDHWHPRIVAALNGQHLKVAKLLGAFLWHHHEHEDELFLVVKGTLRMSVRDAAGSVEEHLVRAGEFLVVPRGVEHRPAADEEVELLLFEPAGTVNTGSAGGERTVAQPEWI